MTKGAPCASAVGDGDGDESECEMIMIAIADGDISRAPSPTGALHRTLLRKHVLLLRPRGTAKPFSF